MWVSSEGRTAYVYVKTDWKERQQKHRQWLRENVLSRGGKQQAKQQRLLRHVRLQQELVLEQLQREEDLLNSTPLPAAAAAPDTCADNLRTPRSSRHSIGSPVGTPRGRSSSRRRASAAADRQQQQQQVVLFHLAARRQQLQVLNELETAQSASRASEQELRQQQPEQSQEARDKDLMEQLRAFRSTHLRLSKW